jgi:hemoglobin
MPDSLFARVGGHHFFAALVDHFYDAVEADAVLRPLYPTDLSPSRQHLALFLAQYWGGPPTYNEQRGHPRLRMRHVPFAIGQPERDAWLAHMQAAVAASPATDADKQALNEYFASAATSLINRFPERGTQGASIGVIT